MDIKGDGIEVKIYRSKALRGYIKKTSIIVKMNNYCMKIEEVRCGML